MRLEVEDSRIGHLEFTVESEVPLLGRRKFCGKEGKRLPMTTDLLLEDTTDMRGGCIGGEGERSTGMS